MVPRTLSLVGELNAEVFAGFLEAFQRADAKKAGPITVYVSSGGGSVDIGNSIYELLRTSQNQVITVGLGDVSSMAVLVLMAGDHRIMTEGTSLLIHDGSVNVEGSMLKMKAFMDENIRQHRLYCHKIAERSGLPPDYLLERGEKEFYLTAAQALTMGLVDEIRRYRKFAPIQIPRSRT